MLRLATPLLVFFFGAPSCIFLHEYGHYFAATSLGCEAKLYAMRTTFTGAFDNQLSADFANLLVTSAGPLVQVFSLMLGSFVLWISVQRYRDTQRPPGLVFWISSLLTLSGLRWLFTIPRGRATDEATISELLGLHWYVMPVALLLLSIAAVVFLIWAHLKADNIVSLLVSVPAAMLGAALWAKVVGPMLLGA